MLVFLFFEIYKLVLIMIKSENCSYTGDLPQEKLLFADGFMTSAERMQMSSSFAYDSVGHFVGHLNLAKQKQQRQQKPDKKEQLAHTLKEKKRQEKLTDRKTKQIH